VPITVKHAGGTNTKTYDQRTGGGVWVLHGTYSFNAGTAGYVQVSDVNGQACADAVKFVPAP
jgi:hyaluronate lyase